MTRKTENMADLMAEYERELAAKADSPEGRAEWERSMARATERVAEEHAKGVRLGWWDEEGNPLTAEEDDEDEDEDEDGDDSDA